MPLHRVMGWRGPITDRQLRTWAESCEAKWNEPDVYCWYLMRVAQRVANVLGGTSQPEDHKLEFGRRRPERAPTAEELAADMEARIARVGGKVRVWKDGKLVERE